MLFRSSPTMNVSDTYDLHGEQTQRFDDMGVPRTQGIRIYVRVRHLSISYRRVTGVDNQATVMRPSSLQSLILIRYASFLIAILRIHDG